MEIGALIANEKVDYLIFFWDPLQSLPHDVDVKALLRIAVLYNVPTACNRATADLIISSPLFHSAEYELGKETNQKMTVCVWGRVLSQRQLFLTFQMFCRKRNLLFLFSFLVFLSL